MKSSLKKLPQSTVELAFELDPEKLVKEREAAFNQLASQVKVPGFRPGRAPRKLIEERMNPTAPLNQALDVVLNEAYHEAIHEHDLWPVSQPQVEIESVDLSKPVSVKISVQVRPEAMVGDWRKIKATREEATVSDEKLEETMKQIWERSAKQKAEGRRQKAEEGLVDAQGNPLDPRPETRDPAPDMSDSWAQSLGAKDLADLREQVRHDLQTSAQYEADTKWQDQILEQVIGMTKVDLPEAFVEDELARMQAHYEQQLSALGITMSQYLDQAGKTLDELRQQWRPQAEKQATMEVALAEIAKNDDINVTDADVDEELAKVDEKTQAQFKDPQQRSYLTYSLWRQKVLKHVLDEVGKNQK